MRALFLLALFLCISAVPAVAQNVPQQDMQRAAKEEIDRIMREGATPAPIPAPAVTGTTDEEQRNEVITPATAAQEKTAPPQAPATAAVPAPEKEKKEPVPCTPEKKDFSGKPPSIEKKYGRRQTEIDKMDTNCNGVLEMQEVTAGIEARFDAADTNKDGVLSKDESAAIIEQFKMESQQEYGTFTDSNARRLENRLDRIDKNGDGKISADEYKTYYKNRYTKFDKNKDGIIDVKEFETDVESRPNTRN